MLLLHILQETWKMKARISRDIGYYTVFPSQGPAVFWLSIQKIAEATLWVLMGLRKRAGTGWEWAGDNFWKSDVAKWDNINRLKSNGSKMTDKLNSIKPWSSICKLNDTPGEVAQLCPTLCDPMDTRLFIGFSRQEYWSGLPFPSPGNLPDPGIEPRSPTL